jgi:hypothetical protein
VRPVCFALSPALQAKFVGLPVLDIADAHRSILQTQQCFIVSRFTPFSVSCKASTATGFANASRGGTFQTKGNVMSIRTAVLFVALGVGAISAPMMASARVYLDVNIAPPAERVEVIPAARVGYVWAPGYWNYSGHQHVWTRGHYIRERRGHEWVADRWEQHGDRWHHERGHWN